MARQVRHEGDTQATIAKARPAWTEGQKVTIITEFGELDYLDFVVGSRLNDDEPIEELVRFFFRRRAFSHCN